MAGMDAVDWRLPWYDWLTELTDWSGGVSQLRRHRAIKIFVKEGLIPLLQSNGYRLACTAQDLCSNIATGLYENQGKAYLESNWNIGHKNTDFLPEEKIHYYDVLNPDIWEDFWGYWGKWSDFDADSERGLDRRYDIQDYMWSQLNLEGSPQTKTILYMLGIDDSGSNTAAPMINTKAEDVYLYEAAESGQYGGYRK